MLSLGHSTKDFGIVTQISQRARLMVPEVRATIRYRCADEGSARLCFVVFLVSKPERALLGVSNLARGSCALSGGTLFR